MSISYQKVKSVGKDVRARGPQLERLILRTMETISNVVGATLGPGGQPVLIERQEHDMPPIVTKDGVTVFRHLGFDDPTQEVILEAARDAAVRTANDAGDGPQPLWSKVLTPNGFVAMGDVRVGMMVCGPDGTIREVLEVFDKGQREIVKVTFPEGRVVECCADHLWSVTTCTGVKKTLTTREIQKDFKRDQSNGDVRYKYFTPRTEVGFSSLEDLPLDPYLVGVLLGDGSLRDSGTIEISLGKAKEHILSKLILPAGISTKVSYHPERNYFRVKIVGDTLGGDTIRDFVARMGLRNVKSETKFIPQNYLLSTRESRLALFQGLIDTDGHINIRGRFEFSTVSAKLAEDFIFLARSLGKSLHVRTHIRKEDEGSYSDRPIYRITELKGDTYGNKIMDVEATGKFTEMRCIKVSGPDHLYVTDNFIVTHNTTSASILAEAIVRGTHTYCRENRRVSPQRVTRRLMEVFATEVEPLIRSLGISANFQTPEGAQLLHSVARISANGDQALAKAVMECFDLVGDGGNVTITEVSGPSAYEVERIEGYPITGMGYEDSCGKYSSKFINDPANQRIFLEKPLFVVYHGKLTEIQTMTLLMEKIGAAWQDPEKSFRHNVVVVATGFSEAVVAQLAFNFSAQTTINVVPLLAPVIPVPGGQLGLLEDLCAVTGAKLFDPLSSPLDTAELSELGSGAKAFEMSRFRTTIFSEDGEKFLDESGLEIVGDAPNMLAVLERVQLLQRQSEQSPSLADQGFIEERIGKLTGGIARLKVIGSSSGEMRERRDRAEDAVCAVRGAIKHGCLPGGGWTLLRCAHALMKLEDPIISQVLCVALMAPVQRLFSNAGFEAGEAKTIVERMAAAIVAEQPPIVYDALEQKFVDPVQGGVLDSLPAVLEAIRNSLSIASLLGTLGATIVFARDKELERHEARETQSWLRSADAENPADERGL